MTCPATVHGTHTARTNHGCTCPEAIEAKYRYDKQWTADALHGVRRTAPREQAVRELRALMANGWPFSEISQRLGYSAKGGLSIYRSPRFTVDKARRIRRLYEELRDVPGPSSSSRLRAAAKGWPTPDELEYGRPPKVAAVLDEVRIERAMRGITPGALTRQERIETVRRLARNGRTHTEITRLLHMSAQRVNQILAQAA